MGDQNDGVSQGFGMTTGVDGETTSPVDFLCPKNTFKSFEVARYHIKSTLKKFWNKKIFPPSSDAQKTGFSSKNFFKSGFSKKIISLTPIKPILIL